jgi:chitodextrinase
VKRRLAALGSVGIGLILAGCCALFNKPPIAEFTFAPVSPYAGETVLFDASRSHDPEGKGLTYSWDFGDGSRGEGKTLTHVFADDGTYSVTLTVKDRFGATDSITKFVEVRNPAPEILKINVKDLNGCRIEAGDMLEFSVDALDPASIEVKKITKITWNFGDETTSEGRVVRHCYSRGCREYTVVVTVTDDDGAQTSASKKIYVYPKDGAPTAIIKISPTEIHVGDKVIFDGRDSHDNDRICMSCPSEIGDCSEISPNCDGCYPYCSGQDRIVSWRWYIKKPCHDWEFLGYGSTLKFVPDAPGTYFVKLEVRDDDDKCCSPCDPWVGVIAQFEVLP